MTPTSHVRFICICVTILASLCAVIGGFLLWKGYSGGEVLVSQIGTAIGGLLGVLSQNRQQAGVSNPDSVQTTVTETKTP